MALSLRLRLLNLWLRLTVKPALARMKSPADFKARFERDAARHFQPPEDSNFVTDVIRRGARPQLVGMIDALWASRGRPDRRKVILYFHGGAYIAGSTRTHKHVAAALAGAAGVRVVLPDYRLAPENPFPAALEDAVSSYRHLLNAGYAPSEIAIAGDSAGAGLGFALLLALRREEMPDPACIAAFSPWVDLTGGAASHRRNAKRDVILPVRRIEEVIHFYLGNHDRRDPLASPLFGDWESPPPALIMASKSEILVDDATGLAERLRAAGGDVQLELWRGLPHAWPFFAGRLSEADQAITNAGAFIARHLSSPEPARQGAAASQTPERA